MREVLYKLYQVPPKCYDQSRVSQTGRETDFFLLDKMGNSYRCEAKLLGKGNPESADAAFARDTQVLIVDTISDAYAIPKNGNSSSAF
ncbi:MAG: CfrBI family restriction endonuclease [Fimbriimonadales bacterium]